MGADLDVRLYDHGEGEPVGDIRVGYSPKLRAITLTGEMSPDLSIAEMIDELPLLALVAASAEGTTTVTGAGELRLKESDRISATVQMLRSLGLTIDELPDGFRINGPQPIIGGVKVDHHGDHRLAMLAGVAGLIAEKPVSMDNPEVAAVSYPDFWSHLASLTGYRNEGR
jgi:3-phosphoshikimate 1-carboxyvinyltransferase